MHKLTAVLSKKYMIYVLAILCCALWGSAYPCIKIGYNLLSIPPDDTASQILFAGLRFTLAGVLTIVIFSLLSKRLLIPRKTSWANIAKLGLVQTIAQYLFFYIGLANATAAKSSIIGGITPFIAILFASFCFRQEKFTKTKLLGSLLGFAGIIIINMDFEGLRSSMTFQGEGFIIISTVACALSSPMTKIFAEKEDPVVLSGYQFIIGGAVMTVVGLCMGGRLIFSDMQAVLIFGYLALLSAISYALWSILLKHHPISKVTVFGFMVPVFGVLLSAMLLDESSQAINLESILALILVSLGIIIINKFQSKSTQQKMTR